MTPLKILGAAALLASAFASPAMAQAVIEDPAYCSNFYPNANCQNYGRGNPYTGRYQHRVYRHDRAWRDSYNRYDPGPFAPAAAAADTAGAIVGSAVGTAAAIATAPIGGEAYAKQNGFECTPGTWFRGTDNLMHPCQ